MLFSKADSAMATWSLHSHSVPSVLLLCGLIKYMGILSLSHYQVILGLCQYLFYFFLANGLNNALDRCQSAQAAGFSRSCGTRLFMQVQQDAGYLPACIPLCCESPDLRISPTSFQSPYKVLEKAFSDSAGNLLGEEAKTVKPEQDRACLNSSYLF